MFILRRITSKDSQSNQVLGESYNLITEEQNPKDFKETSLIFWKQEQTEETYGFIIHNDGSKIIPLNKKSFYYIMTSNGQTFANITYR